MTVDDRGVITLDVRALRGPNIHAYMPVLQIAVDIGAYEDQPSTAFDGFAERLIDWLPGLRTHECSLGRPGGFAERLRRGTYLPHVLEHVTLELQTVMGFDVGFGRATGPDERGAHTIVVAYREEHAAREAFATAVRLTLAALHDERFDVAAETERLLSIADEYRIGPSTAAIVGAARARNIPVMRLKPTGSLVQLGYGVHQRRIWASETSHTSAIAVDLCQDKPLTNDLLRSVGVPVPDGRPVTSADEAWQVAQEIESPVVIKPQAGNQGKGVSANLRAEADIRAAYEIAAGFGNGVLVEEYVEGQDYRLLVINGRMVAAARREPAMVVGDGQHTVRELVDEVNRDPRRRDGHSTVLSTIQLDDTARLVLQQQGLCADSILEAGRGVKLRENCNLSTGGTATDVTDEVHPRNVRIAELAAQILRLDVAGIDILCEDIRRPIREQGGAIVEVNAAPGLRMHLFPSDGTPRDVGTPIIDMLYPNDAPSRIPIIAVTGTNGKTTVTRLIAHMYETAKKLVGMTLTEGTYIDGERIIRGDCSGPKSARAVLLHPHVEAAVLETARGGIIREGLAFDACTVGVVTNVTSDHLGLKGIHTLEDLSKVKQVVVENVARDGAAVLNAEDSLVAQMAAATDGEVIYFSYDPRNPVMASHLANGGRGVFVANGSITLATGTDWVPLVEIDHVGFTVRGKIRFQVMNALAATAAGWGARLNPALIARALSTFTTDAATVPGRFNLIEAGNVEVVIDYGHNPAAMEALGQAVEALGARRTIMLLGLPGDRRDDDLLATMDETLKFAHEYIFFDLPDLRGRNPGDVPALLRSRIPPGVASSVAMTQEDGVRRAWEEAGPGDRLLLIVDDVDEAIEQVRALAGSRSQDNACLPAAMLQGQPQFATEWQLSVG